MLNKLKAVEDGVLRVPVGDVLISGGEAGAC
jgi:hypothetical protein